LGLKNIIPPESETKAGGPFLCLICFRNLEKYSRVKTNLIQMDTDLKAKIKSGNSPCRGSSLSTEISTPVPGKL